MDPIVTRKLIKDVKTIQCIIASIEQHPIEIDYYKAVNAEPQQFEDASFEAEINGKVVGFMTGYILSDVFGVGKSTRIARIGVDSKYMDQGIRQPLAGEIFTLYKEKEIQNVFTSLRWDSTDLFYFSKLLDLNTAIFSIFVECWTNIKLREKRSKNYTFQMNQLERKSFFIAIEKLQ